MKMAFYDEVGKPTVLDKGPFLSGFCCGIGPKGLDRVQGPLAHAQDAGRDRSACRNESRHVVAVSFRPQLTSHETEGLKATATTNPTDADANAGLTTGKKKRKTANRRVKITNTHIPGIDLTRGTPCFRWATSANAGPCRLPRTKQEMKRFSKTGRRHCTTTLYTVLHLTWHLHDIGGS
jgi:hypothetical protein